MSNVSFYKWRAEYGGVDASLISQMKAIDVNVHSKVTQQMLAAQLRELEKDCIVARMVYAQVPPRRNTH